MAILPPLLNNDIIPRIFHFVPTPQLHEMRKISQGFKNFIDHHHELQTRIAYFYLIKNQHRTHLSLEGIRYALYNSSLVIEVENDLNTHLFTTEFASIIPRIGHMIFKGCKGPGIGQLLNRLKGSQQLTLLYFHSCTLSEPSLLSGWQKVQKIFYNVELQGDVDLKAFCSSHQITIASANQYSIENLDDQTPGVDHLKEFEKQVNDNSATADAVVKAFDAIKEVVQRKVVFSIWYSVLMQTEDTSKKPIDAISIEARKYIAEHPHHPSVMAAIRT